MNNQNFPLNFINEDKSLIFWMAFVRLKTAYYADLELPKEWLEVLFENASLLADSMNDLNDISQSITPEEKIYTVISEALQTQLSESNDYERKLQEFITNSNDKIGAYLMSKMMRSDPHKAVKSKIHVTNQSLISFEAFKGEKTSPYILGDEFFSDKTFSLAMPESYKDKPFSLLKRDLVRNIFNISTEYFDNRKKYFRSTLTGYFCGCSGVFDTEDEHNASERNHSYRQYLINNVKQHVKDLD